MIQGLECHYWWQVRAQPRRTLEDENRVRREEKKPEQGGREGGREEKKGEK